MCSILLQPALAEIIAGLIVALDGVQPLALVTYVFLSVLNMVGLTAAVANSA
jgi:hypothetical protein